LTECSVWHSGRSLRFRGAVGHVTGRYGSERAAAVKLLRTRLRTPLDFCLNAVGVGKLARQHPCPSVAILLPRAPLRVATGES